MTTPQEIATLTVNGKDYSDWKSVELILRWANWFPEFTFEASEEVELPKKISGLQIKPGDIVQASLGGVPVLHGYVIERHAAYDAKNHGVRIVGVGKTFDLTNSCVPLDKLGNHDGKTWSKLCKDLTQHLGIGLQKFGAVDEKPFEQIQVQPGETIAAVLERYARMRKIIIGSKPNGDVLAVGDHSGQSVDTLEEGRNILRANCAIRDEHLYKAIFALGQQNSNDQHSGDVSNKQIAKVSGSSTRNRHMVFATEIADDQHGLQRRAEMEKLFTEGTKIEAHITVQGWFRDSGALWKDGDYYHVRSPSLILDRTLGCRAVHYEQSDAGTTTTLEMVDPYHMSGKLDFSAEGG